MIKNISALVGVNGLTVAYQESAMFSARSITVAPSRQTVRDVVWAGGEASTIQAIVFREESSLERLPRLLQAV